MDDLSRHPKPPEAARKPVTVTRFGETLVDDYAWLRDPDWRAVMRDPARLSPEIRTHLEAENAYCDAVLADTAGLQETLVAEMRGRIAEDDVTVPERDGAYAYYRRYEHGAEHPVICRRPADGGTEEIVFDGPAAAEGQSYFRLVACVHAPDHRTVAVVVDSDGSEYCDVIFKDMASGVLLPDRLKHAQGDLAWANDGRTAFYTVLDDDHRPLRVYRHRLGDDPADDALVYAEADEGFYLALGKTETGRFILIRGHAHATMAEIRLIDAEAPARAPVLFAERSPGHDYEVAHAGDTFFIRTNADGAEDFKIMAAPIDAFARENWQEVVPHRPGRFIRRIAAFADHLVWLERETALAAIRIRRLSDGAESTLAFDEEAYDLAIERGYEFETTALRIVYSSPATPDRTYDVDMNTGARTLRKEQRVPSGHDPADYVVRRLWADARDGARIPISLVHRRGVALDGTNPLLLYGYGAYGMAMPASFATNRLSLVDRGMIYAIAHIRGGSDCGHHWYEDGKLANKPNTFRDFIDVAEHLIAEGYTAPKRIVALGRSAGGLLMGAVANMRPDLFQAVVSEVPFVDVLNTMCDASLPLTPPEWTEWGNPLEDEAAYRAIRSYCPYTNVAAQAYPHILAVAGLTDPRVTYWEPAKWIARLRAMRSDDGLTLLHTVMEAGHGGAPGRFARLSEVARTYAVALKACGIDN